MIIFSTEPPVKLSCSKETGSITEHFTGEALVLELEVSHNNAEVCWMKMEWRWKREQQHHNYREWPHTQAYNPFSNSEWFWDIYLQCHRWHNDFKVKITGMMVNNYFLVFFKVISTFFWRFFFIFISSEAPVKILNKDQIKSEHKVALFDDVVLECELSTANGGVVIGIKMEALLRRMNASVLRRKVPSEHSSFSVQSCRTLENILLMLKMIQFIHVTVQVKSVFQLCWPWTCAWSQKQTTVYNNILLINSEPSCEDNW